MNSKLLEQLAKSIQDKVRCPVCGSRYSRSSIIFKGRLNSFYLFQLICSECHSNVFASVMLSGDGLFPRADIFLDRPTRSEPLRKSPIKADEVIEFARVIDKFKGPFSKWLR